MDRLEVRALLDGELCSIARTVELIGDRWSLLVLREAFYGVSRFEALRANLGISRAVLTDRLDALVEHGLLERIPYRAQGQRTRDEYRLSEAGAELLPVLVALLQWGDKHRNEGNPPIVLRHAGCGAPVGARIVCARGHQVAPDDVEPAPGPGIVRRAPGHVTSA